jgi:hypothetical protein
MLNATTLAQREWKQSLVGGSVIVLDETLNIWACTIATNRGRRTALHWGPMRLVLPSEAIQQLAAWDAAQQAHFCAAERSESEREGEAA